MSQAHIVRSLVLLGSAFAVGAAVFLRPFWSPVVLGRDPQGAVTAQAVAPSRSPAPAPTVLPNAGQPVAPGRMGGMEPIQVGHTQIPLKNAPNVVTDQRGLQLSRSSAILVVETEDGKELAAMDSRAHGKVDWARYTIPPGISVTPFMTNDLATFMARGDSVTEVAAYSSSNQAWVTQKLLHPVKEAISPAVAYYFVLFQEGQNFYAFSGKAGKWDVLELDGPEVATATINTTDITVIQGNRLYVFPLGSARWTKGIAVKRASGIP